MDAIVCVNVKSSQKTHIETYDMNVIHERQSISMFDIDDDNIPHLNTLYLHMARTTSRWNEKHIYF